MWVSRLLQTAAVGVAVTNFSCLFILSCWHNTLSLVFILYSLCQSSNDLSSNIDVPFFILLPRNMKNEKRIIYIKKNSFRHYFWSCNLIIIIASLDDDVIFCNFIPKHYLNATIVQRISIQLYSSTRVHVVIMDNSFSAENKYVNRDYC